MDPLERKELRDLKCLDQIRRYLVNGGKRQFVTVIKKIKRPVQL
jgi:hypothetical protein